MLYIQILSLPSSSLIIMKIESLFLVITLPFLISGCVPFASNEFNTKLWLSEEKRIQGYKQRLDYEIGKEFYSTMDKSEICSKQECIYISETVTEYIYEWEENTNPPRKCIFAWLVDESQSKGPNPYGNKHLLSLGRKIKWRYISNPDQCLDGINFLGPW